MHLSGIIFVLLAVAWAVYLIPQALRHHDEVARTRSIERFSTAMRVLARREPVNRRDSRLVLTPARRADNPRLIAPSTTVSVTVSAESQTLTQSVPTRAQRAAARTAARRRRCILSVLLLSTLVVVGLAYVALVLWWAVAVPAGLSLVFLVVCRVQVRRLDRARAARIGASVEHEVDTVETVVRRTATRIDAPYGTPTAFPLQREARAADEIDADGDTMSIPVVVEGVVETQVETVVEEVSATSTLWDPLPVTLPTYVTKAKAKRTVRTIDLGEPGTWTSGHTAEDSRSVLEGAADPKNEDGATTAEADGTASRAVGS